MLHTSFGLFDRQLHEHQPAERHHRRVSGEHVAAEDVLGLAASACASRARGLTPASRRVPASNKVI
jgi:hypothetical protein